MKQKESDLRSWPNCPCHLWGEKVHLLRDASIPAIPSKSGSSLTYLESQLWNYIPHLEIKSPLCPPFYILREDYICLQLTILLFIRMVSFSSQVYTSFTFAGMQSWRTVWVSPECAGQNCVPRAPSHCCCCLTASLTLSMFGTNHQNKCIIWSARSNLD